MGDFRRHDQPPDMALLPGGSAFCRSKGFRLSARSATRKAYRYQFHPRTAYIGRHGAELVAKGDRAT